MLLEGGSGSRCILAAPALQDIKDWVTDPTNNLDRFDFVFIDALHTEEFSTWYTRNLLLPKSTPAQVVIHDIVAGEDGMGRESMSVYLFLAFTARVRNVFSMARGLMPDPFSANDEIDRAVWEVRRQNGIVTSTYGGRGATWMVDSDIVSIRCARSPSIFFSLMPKGTRKGTALSES